MFGDIPSLRNDTMHDWPSGQDKVEVNVIPRDPFECSTNSFSGEEEIALHDFSPTDAMLKTRSWNDMIQ